MGLFDRVKAKLSSPKAKMLFSISIIWLGGCFILLIPTFRYLIISTCEIFLNRSLDHQMWHERFIICGMSGLWQYIIFFFIYVLYKYRKNGKVLLRLFTVFFMLVYCLVFLRIITYNAAWYLGGDDYHFIRTTAINKYLPMSEAINNGRFFPFASMQFNISLFILRCLGINTGLSVNGHYVVVSIFYIASFIFLYLLFKRINYSDDNSLHFFPDLFFNLFFSTTFFALGYSYMEIFLNIVYPETAIILFFSLFIFLYYKAIETNNTIYYIFALLCAVYCSYCKEPVFGVFIVIALTNHIFRYRKESKREKMFYNGLIFNAFFFIILYYFISLKSTTGFYGGYLINATELNMGKLKSILAILKRSPFLFFMLLISIIRLYFIIAKKDREHLYYDSLLFAGVAYICAYFILLNFTHDYYFMPAIILFCPSLVYWVKYAYNKKHIYGLCIFILIIPVYAIQVKDVIQSIRTGFWIRWHTGAYMTTLCTEYYNGKEFVFYEATDDGKDYMRNYRMRVENTFLNYFTGDEGKQFFTVKKDNDDLNYLNEDILFFYPRDNYNWKPMPENLANSLQENSFVKLDEHGGIIIYGKH